MTDDDRLASTVRAAWGGPRAGCLAPASLLPSELASLGAEERRRVEQHLRECPACAAEAELAASFERDEGSRSEEVAWIVGRLESTGPGVGSVATHRATAVADDESASGEPRLESGARPAAPVVPLRRRAPSRLLLPLAAALAVALGSSLVVRELGFWPAPLPERRAGDVVRGDRVDAVAPEGELAAPPERFEWTSAKEAVIYRLTVRGVDGAVLWSQGDIHGDSAAPAAELRERLLPNVRYRWQVEALDATGAVLAASEPTDFVVRGDHRERATP